MQRRELTRLRRSLARRLADLTRKGRDSLRSERRRNQQDIGVPGDEGDQAVRIVEVDTELRMGAREMALAQQIEAAIARIDAGVYGRCVDCGEPIERERLALVPWARRCVADQEARDQERGTPPPPTL